MYEYWSKTKYENEKIIEKMKIRHKRKTLKYPEEEEKIYFVVFLF